MATANQAKYEAEKGAYWSKRLLERLRNPQTIELHGRLAYKADQLDEAKASLEELLEIETNNSKVHYYLGCVKGKVDANSGVRNLKLNKV